MLQVSAKAMCRPHMGSVVTTKPMRPFSVASLDERRVSSAHSRTKLSEQQHCGKRKRNRSKLCNIYVEEKGWISTPKLPPLPYTHTLTHTHTHTRTHTYTHTHTHARTHARTHTHSHTHTTTLFPFALCFPIYATREMFKVPSTYRPGIFSILPETLSCTS